MNIIGQFFTNLLGGLLGGISGPIQPLVSLIGNTPLGLTTANTVVDAAWTTMTVVADALLGLLVTVKAIQVMYGQSVGAVYLPMSQFVPKAILVAVLIHLSAILGQDLILLNDALCGLVKASVQDFILQVNGGHPFDIGQSIGFATVLALVFAFSLVRIIFQALKRIVFFNLLYVLSGPAFLLSFDEQTAPWFGFWARTYLATAFTQFLQFLALGLGLQFLLATKQTGATGFLLGVAMLTFTAEIPGLLARFSATAGANTAGIGSIARAAVTAGSLFI